MTAHAVIIVAARDEAERIGATLAGLELAFPGAQVWVADDGSRDGTAEIARAAGARVVRTERAIGKGSAVTAAVYAALDDARAASRAPANEPARENHDAPVFVLCDGDLAESARELGALAAAVAVGDADVAVAVFSTRAGGGLGLALAFARWAIRRRCGLAVTAPISGQRALSPRALGDVLPFAAGYGIEVGMTIDAVRAGHRVREIELDLAHRASGRTFAGFTHRGRQLVDCARAYLARA